MLEILKHLPCMSKNSIYVVTAPTLEKAALNAKRGPFEDNCPIISKSIHIYFLQK